MDDVAGGARPGRDEIELVHLCEARFRLRDPIVVDGTPVGTRLVFEVESGRVEGDRLAADVRGSSSADWAAMDARGLVTLDVRLLLETDDGALVISTYAGRAEAGGPVFAAPRYDTGDERYLWLNQVQAVAKGRLEGNDLTYQIYEVR